MQNRYRFSIKGNLLNATKGKIIFGFLMAIFALFAAWAISRVVFSKIIETVDLVSQPDEKLILVNQLYHIVSGLDQTQKYLAVEKDDGNAFIKDTRAIKRGLDTLRNLYLADTLQLRRIKSVEKLLGKRNRQFLLYLTVRDSLLNTNSFTTEIEKLNTIFAERVFLSDSAVYTTESKTSTTTLLDERKSGFFNKLFGKKKADSYKVVSEELKIKKDTLDQFVEDSILRDMENSLSKIKNRQQLKSNKFIAKERSLADASNTLTQQMLKILEEVRTEAQNEAANNGITAKRIVSRGIEQITIILILFFILIVFLSYFILKDIGKSNKYRLALEKAKETADYNARAKQRFLSNMSHEIRTPLQSIVGYSEIIRKTTLPDKNALNAIYLSATHLLYIINEILDYSRIASGKFNLKHEPFEVSAIINEVMLVVKPLAMEKNLAINEQIELSGNLWVLGDAFRLKQILYNLIGNAIKFTNAGTVTLIVTVSGYEKKQTLHIQVADTGTGISEKNLATIFEEFDNGNSTGDVNFKSTGLGLSIVKQLVELHGGNITVESRVDSGTTFNLLLNYGLVSADNSLELDVFSEIPTVKKYVDKVVWIVDDDQLILDLCGIILTQKQIEHKKFNDPYALLTATIPANLGTVFIDMRMPKMDGLTLYKQLKLQLPACVKVYAITAQVLADEQQHILEAGISGIINKPFTEKQILEVLEDYASEFEDFNPENLKKMTFGDQHQLKKILKRFVDDCSNDIELLRAEIVNRNYNLCRLIVHRLAGRTGQIGYRGLAHQFRSSELKLQNNQSFTEDVIIEIKQHLNKLKKFTDYLVKNNYSI